MNRVLVLVCVGIFSSSCSLFTRKQNQNLPDDKMMIQEAYSLLEKGQNKQALDAFRSFSENNRSSVYYLESRLGEAQAQIYLENFEEAYNAARDVSIITTQDQLQFKAQAFYLLSFALEGLGSDVKPLAALLDAYRLKKELPPQVGLAEVPARIAGQYGRMGHEKEAHRFLAESEKGLAEALSKTSPAQSKEWLARTYFQMGSVTTNQLSSDNFSSFVDGQRWVQVYLIKALKQDHPLWSKKALESLQQVYRDLLKVMELEQRRQDQYGKASELLEIIDQADLYKPLSEHKVVSYEQDFFLFLKEIRRQGERILYEGGQGMGLTEAAQERNSLKRMPRRPSPKEKPQVIQSNEIGEDPNL